ncbi:MAG: EAL domain-containing protein [Gammaproteobacteria bacterium]|nr:EAL domain-containing protein [Gammaproteobacteria bacterium]
MTSAAPESPRSATTQRLLITLFFVLVGVAVIFGLDLGASGRLWGGAFILAIWCAALLMHKSLLAQRALAGEQAAGALSLIGRYQALTVWQVDGRGQVKAVYGGETGGQVISRALVPDQDIARLIKENPALAALVQSVRCGHRCAGEAEINGVMYRHQLIPQSQEGEYFGFTCISEDLSHERQEAATTRLWNALQEHSSDAVVVLDRHRVVVAANTAFTTITGYRQEDAIGQRDNLLLSKPPGENYYQRVFDQLQDAESWHGETMLRHRSGHLFDVRLVVCKVKDNAGQTANYIVTFADLSQTKRIHDELRHLATHDNLTDLPNRRLFLDRLDQGVRRARREQRQLAIFFIDLDDFKAINDDYGHHVGDEILRQAGSRLLGAVRESDTVARLAGDEFTVIADSPHDEAAAIQDKISTCLVEPFEIGDRAIKVSASVGAAIYPDHGESLESLMQFADQSMYEAKARRKGTKVAAFQKAQPYNEGLYFPSELRLAIRRDQLKLVYQPQIDLHTGGLMGVEALLRWEHHCRGSINPTDFMGLAEDAGITDAISTWTLEQVAKQLKAWRRWRMPIKQVAINIAISQIKDPRYPQAVVDAMAKRGIPVTAIMLEVDEEIYLRSPGLCRIFFDRARQLGLRLCIDQFGVHGGEYAYIGNVPVDAVKINQRLLSSQIAARNDPRFIPALVALCKVAGKAVIAVGVESSTTESELILAGCELAQGFLYSRPLSAEAMRTFRIEPALPNSQWSAREVSGLT